jgi:NADH-quinone oxidoreductase subunit E
LTAPPFALTPAIASDILEIKARYPVAQSALVPSLLRVQAEFGWVPPDTHDAIASLLGIETSVVAEVASFYLLVFTEPVGKRVIQLCTNVSCLLAGGEAVRARVEAKLGVKTRETTADGRYTYIVAECLGACEEAPCMIVGEKRYGRLTPESVDEVLGKSE